jgi:hypothetical protein
VYNKKIEMYRTHNRRCDAPVKSPTSKSKSKFLQAEVKMTLLLNYRFYSHNIPRTTKITLDKRAKKMSPSNKKNRNSPTSSPSHSPSPKRENPLKKKIAPSTPPASPMMMPSAPPTLMSMRSIYINNQLFQVEIPEEFDIYEGLRHWYPSLYSAVLEEHYENHQNIVSADEVFTEEEMEEMWGHYDYLEYLYD